MSQQNSDSRVTEWADLVGASVSEGAPGDLTDPFDPERTGES